MAVFDRSELQASPLADLHAIADQLGLDGFRRLRKADLIDAILGEPSTAASADTASDGSAADTPVRRRGRSRGGCAPALEHARAPLATLPDQGHGRAPRRGGSSRKG